MPGVGSKHFQYYDNVETLDSAECGELSRARYSHPRHHGANLRVFHPGKTIIVATVFTHYQLRVPANFILVNLALSDLTTGVFVQTYFVYLVGRSLSGVEDFCLDVGDVIVLLAGTTTFVCTLTTLFLATVDRLIAFELHMRYNTLVTMKRVKLALGLCWAKRNQRTEAGLEKAARSRKEFKAVITVFIVLVTLTATCLPRSVMTYVIRSMHKEGAESPQTSVLGLLSMLVLLGPCINPLVYIFRSKRLRRYVDKRLAGRFLETILEGC
ncbi:predicted protein [Nematostella vectensis]|uniref:G-protein coupled receptors family 1 profile domain-containing protein n=1 Tax=Nematostella vectensis TaxID=45351 RepID=A7SXJ8_NEMVE|nr:predicted protein [Nematostella vectensis]|eukprot:XP_001623654.1 predicted protein [Nematostella vectensis]